ncbi:GroEL-like equatorial domain superfamily [Sesbania bispinosa]|nr:GroEL-like equatorial domain superfamily [Sesbania bispinosa]
MIMFTWGTLSCNGAVVGDDFPGCTIIGSNNTIGYHAMIGVKCQDLKYKLFHRPQLMKQGPCCSEVELEDPVENIGAKLVRQAAANTNDLTGHGTMTSVVLAQGLIVEDVKVGLFFCLKL